MTIDLDRLIEQSLAEGEIESGVPLQQVITRNPGAYVTADLRVQESGSGRGVPWGPAEDAFVAENYIYYTDAEIGAVLGRSEIAVKLRRQRYLNLRGVSRRDDIFSAQGMAKAIGIDSHSALKLMDRGLIASWNHGERNIRLTHKVTLYRWAINPMHWPYFINSVRNTAQITDLHLRRLVERQKKRWDDDWWIPSQVADYHGVEHTDVNRYIQAGKIQSIKWGNHWVLRSEALKPELVFYKGKGSSMGYDWSEAADCFILIGRALGVPKTTLAHMIKWGVRTLGYRLGVLHRRGMIPDLIGKFGLEIEYDPATGGLSAEWAKYGYMFPRVATGDLEVTDE